MKTCALLLIKDKRQRDLRKAQPYKRTIYLQLSMVIKHKEPQLELEISYYITLQAVLLPSHRC